MGSRKSLPMEAIAPLMLWVSGLNPMFKAFPITDLM
jgi:hypothetical protein